MKVSNVCRYLIALLTAQSQGIDPVDEVLLHLSCLQTTALSLSGLKITISRSLGIVLTFDLLHSRGTDSGAEAALARVTHEAEAELTRNCVKLLTKFC